MIARIFLLSLFFCLGLVSCKSPDARRPVQTTSGSFIKESVERNKKLYQEEKAVIKKIMDADLENSYFASDSGFWYYYNTRKESDLTQTPKTGDTITFIYNIEYLDGTTVISEKENGLQHYIIDKSNQDLVSGIRDGLKLMKEGETVTFLLPSYKAYGYYGIDNKLGTNIPIQSRVTLKTIDQTNEN
ncbi:MAG: gliding motility-associated peptidyl-prolyl isomerase [Sediminicola sp.]|jgi:gliding motility-associated peptidyl-prolyl isomerase|tara:strand:- start:6790 stop:7350 length:561 start_codon:yes stop_codon:yes gene_type:complete